MSSRFKSAMAATWQSIVSLWEVQPYQLAMLLIAMGWGGFFAWLLLVAAPNSGWVILSVAIVQILAGIIMCQLTFPSKKVKRP